MEPEEFEMQAAALLKRPAEPLLAEPLTVRIEQIGVAARSAWVSDSETPPILRLINEALEGGDKKLQRLIRLYVLPNLHLIGVPVEAQQSTVDRLPEPLRSEWLSSQQDLDAIQKQAE